MVTDAGQVLDTTTTHQHHAVLLQAVSFARNVSSYFDVVRQTNTGDFAQGRIWFLRRHGLHLGADPAFLWCAFAAASTFLRISIKRILQRRGLRLGFLGLPALAHQLINGWHKFLQTLASLLRARKKAI